MRLLLSIKYSKSKFFLCVFPFLSPQDYLPLLFSLITSNIILVVEFASYELDSILYIFQFLGFSFIMTTQKFFLLLSVVSLCTKIGDIVHATSEDGLQQTKMKGICDGDSEMDFDCGEGELRMRCINSFWHCDQIYDCSTGKDELDCSYLHKCPTGYIACRNGDCFLATHRCDGRDDCGDGWDERGCEGAKTATVDSSLNFAGRIHRRPLNEEEHEDILEAEHQAEAMVDDREEYDGEPNSAMSLLLISTLLIVLFTLVGLLLFRRYPDTASRLDHTLKEFNRNVGSSARSLLGNGLASTRSHVTISTPGNNSNNDQQFFDNPLHLHQPLVLGVHPAATRSNTSSPISQPLIV